MTAPNGRANDSALDNPNDLVAPPLTASAVISPSTGPQFSLDHVKHLIAELEVPFDPAVIKSRVTNTTKSGKLSGQVIPYADPRAYTDRLNSLIHSRRLDPEVYRPYQRQLRAESRPEDGRKGIRDM